MEAKQVPLTELLEAVPADARLVVDDGPYSTRFIPVGKMCHEAAVALRERLAQPVQEPVAWMWRCKPYCGWPEWSVSLKRPADSGRDGHKRTEGYEDVPLYTSPPASKPLTEEEIDELAMDKDGLPNSHIEFARAIERAHGIGEKPDAA